MFAFYKITYKYNNKMLKPKIFKELDTVTNRVALAAKLGKSEQAIKMAIIRKSDVLTKIDALRAICQILGKQMDDILIPEKIA
jgi:hypothetical protein